MARITLVSVAEEKWSEFLEAFLLIHPVPTEWARRNDPEVQLQWVQEKAGSIIWGQVYSPGCTNKRNRDHPATPDPDILR